MSAGHGSVYPATGQQPVEFWGDSRMPYVETRRACHSRICYKPHSHPTFSIGAVDAGQSQFRSYFAREQHIQAGSLVVIPAHVEHSCNPLPDQAWSYQMMHLDADWLHELLTETVDTPLNSVMQSSLPRLRPQVLSQPVLYSAFCRLNHDLFNPDVSISEKEQRLITMLIDLLLPEFQLQRIGAKHYFTAQLKHLMDQLTQSTSWMSLQEMADAIGVSRYAVIRIFKAHSGLTPHAFQLNQRVNRARQLLKQPVDIAQVAHALGFTDQSHFHRVFKMHTGITPGHYQRAFKKRAISYKN
ncbi:helix-turn-helix domain-containing protein [Acinetobacter sp. WZC-1]|uniref:helix-turn-helix domain-containing protein n=1 Tax=Acinetobacter sp. WZC-1 TaxID=3459034 RepID=UPI00403D8D7F